MKHETTEIPVFKVNEYVLVFLYIKICIYIFLLKYKPI